METNTTMTVPDCVLPVLVHDWSVTTPFGQVGALKYSTAPWYLRFGQSTVAAAPVVSITVALAVALAITLIFWRRRRHAA